MSRIKFRAHNKIYILYRDSIFVRLTFRLWEISENVQYKFRNK